MFLMLKTLGIISPLTLQIFYLFLFKFKTSPCKMKSLPSVAPPTPSPPPPLTLSLCSSVVIHRGPSSGVDCTHAVAQRKLHSHYRLKGPATFGWAEGELTRSHEGVCAFTEGNLNLSQFQSHCEGNALNLEIFSSSLIVCGDLRLHGAPKNATGQTEPLQGREPPL